LHDKRGVALEYSGDVPKIIAVAKGKLLEKMLLLAKKNNITIHRDHDLALVLSQLKAGEEIPEDLYKAVAEILAYCYKINSEFRKKIGGSGI